MKKISFFSMLTVLLIALCSCGSAGNISGPGNNTEEPQKTENRIFAEEVSEGLLRLDHIENARSAHIQDGRLYADFAGAASYSEEDGYSFPEVTLKAFDLYSGEIVAEKAFDGEYSSSFKYYDDGTIGVTHYGIDGFYQLFDSSLSEPLGEYYWEYSKDSTTPEFYKNYAYTIADGILYRTDLVAWETDVMAEDLPYESHILGCGDTFVYIATDYTDDARLLRFRTSTMEFRVFKGYPSYSFRFANDHMYFCRYGYSNIQTVDTGENIYIENGFKTEFVILVDKNYVFTTDSRRNNSEYENDPVIRAYHLPDGEMMFKSSSEYFGSDTGYDYIEPLQVLEDEKKLLVHCTKENYDESDSFDSSEGRFFLADTSIWQPIEKELDPALEPASFAEYIENRYGVYVFAGADVYGYPGEDYSVEECDDIYTTGKALRVLADTLEKFPEGFFREYTSASAEDRVEDKLAFYITGTINGPDYSTSEIAALTTPLYEDNWMESHIALDVYYMNTYETNIAHELWHAIEDRLYATDEKEFDKFTNGWLKLNPRGVYYNYGYRDNSGDDYNGSKYTLTEPVNGNVYFMDSYSLTWPHEDRARIFENLFTTGDIDTYYAIPWQFDYKGTYDKGKYLCEALENQYESVKLCNLPHWEKMYELTKELASEKDW